MHHSRGVQVRLAGEVCAPCRAICRASTSVLRGDDGWRAAGRSSVDWQSALRASAPRPTVAHGPYRGGRAGIWTSWARFPNLPPLLHPPPTQLTQNPFSKNEKTAPSPHHPPSAACRLLLTSNPSLLPAAPRPHLPLFCPESRAWAYTAISGDVRCSGRAISRGPASCTAPSSLLPRPPAPNRLRMLPPDTLALALPPRFPAKSTLPPNR